MGVQPVIIAGTLLCITSSLYCIIFRGPPTGPLKPRLPF